MFLSGKSGWSFTEDHEADTRKIEVDNAVWDSFLADDGNKKKYRWYRYHAVSNWRLLEEAFGDRVATGAHAISSTNLLSSRDRPESGDDDDVFRDDQDEIETQLPVSEWPPTQGPSQRPSKRSSKRPAADSDTNSDDLDAPLRAGRKVLGGKRPAAGKTTSAPRKRVKKEAATSSRNATALASIAEHLGASLSQRISEARMPWQRVVDLIQAEYSKPWGKLSAGALVQLPGVLQKTPPKFRGQGVELTYADLILQFNGKDSRRDKIVLRAMKDASELDVGWSSSEEDASKRGASRLIGGRSSNVSDSEI
jgi:hypothetical protein